MAFGSDRISSRGSRAAAEGAEPQHSGTAEGAEPQQSGAEQRADPEHSGDAEEFLPQRKDSGRFLAQGAAEKA